MDGQTSMSITFVLIFLAMIIVAIFQHIRWTVGDKKNFNRDNLLRALSQHVVHSADRTQAFDPATAVLVCEQIVLRKRSSYIISESSCIFRNDAGEYFLFLFKLGTPGVLTYLTRDRAKNALRFDPEIFASEFPGAK
jgi:hypothetical protein